jgi:hypothetical protein
MFDAVTRRDVRFFFFCQVQVALLVEFAAAMPQLVVGQDLFWKFSRWHIISPPS